MTVTLSAFAALIYNLFVLLYFMKKTLCMSERNPMHRDYRAHILKSGNQFCMLYMLSALLICFCLAVIVYNCYRIVQYNTAWIDVLEPFKEAYKCTESSIWIDLDQLRDNYKGSEQWRSAFAMGVMSAVILPTSLIISIVANWFVLLKYYKDLVFQ